MGKLDPSQQDKWWKSRIEKEELQYGIKNGTQDSGTRRDVTFLNTLGQPQVIALASESHLNGAGAIVSPRNRPPSAQPAAHDAAAEETRSVASAGKPKSVASAAKNSQAPSSSHSAQLMKRLEGLEEALASERIKRLQAEEEMRQLMALQQQQRRPGGK